MDRLSKKVTPAAADKPVRRSPRNNVENNPPPQPQSSKSFPFVPSNLVVGDLNFGGVSKKADGANKAFKFTAREGSIMKDPFLEMYLFILAYETEWLSYKGPSIYNVRIGRGVMEKQT